MLQWYFSCEGQESGPHDLGYAKSYVREHPGAYCWRAGWFDWRPVYEVTEIWPVKSDGVTPFPRPPREMLSPKPERLPDGGESIIQKESAPMVPAAPVKTHEAGNTQLASSGFGATSQTEGIDFKIYGQEMQYVEIELDPNESAVAEAGSMMYKSPSVVMETVFGDGSSQQRGFMDLLIGAGKRLLTNESLFITVFTQKASSKGKVAFAAPFPGTIMALNLGDFNGKLICQKDSFLAAAKGVQIGIQFQRRILTGLFGGEGFILQKLEGTGWVFVHMGGTIHKVELAPGESLHVDTGCLAAMTATVDYDIEQAGGIKTMLFGGEGVFFAKLTGPGTAWLQSLPFSRLAGRMLAAAPQRGGSREEGSILGPIGNLLDGDNF